MGEKQENNKNLFSPVRKDVEQEFSEEDEQDSSSTSSGSRESPNTAAEQSGLKLSGTTHKVELCCSNYWSLVKQMAMLSRT